ncbi:MAG: chemotaxis protein CheD [Spirochaetia bacterium]|nr:chemotaxis protein CheD [Spirochaetia bacterium]
MALQRGNLIHVGVAEWKTADEPDALWTTLGSCVGIVLYSTKKKTGGLAHVLLGESPSGKIVHRGKYARPAVEGLAAEVEKRGVARSELSARIFGGASMFDSVHSAFMNQIGSDNVQAVKSALSALGIPIIAEDTGGSS